MFEPGLGVLGLRGGEKRKSKKYTSLYAHVHTHGRGGAYYAKGEGLRGSYAPAGRGDLLAFVHQPVYVSFLTCIYLRFGRLLYFGKYLL